MDHQASNSPQTPNMIDTVTSYPCQSGDKPKPRLSFLARYQIAVPTAIQELTASTETTSLCSSFKPGEYDIVCGRGKGSYNCPGNKKFRAIVNRNIDRYLAAKSRLDKSLVLASIIDEVRQQNNGNVRFVKKDKNQGWVEISEDQVREKAGHTIRETIAALEKKKNAKDSTTITKKEVETVPVPVSTKNSAVLQRDIARTSFMFQPDAARSSILFQPEVFAQLMSELDNDDEMKAFALPESARSSCLIQPEALAALVSEFSGQVAHL